MDHTLWIAARSIVPEIKSQKATDEVFWQLSIFTERVFTLSVSVALANLRSGVQPAWLSVTFIFLSAFVGILDAQCEPPVPVRLLLPLDRATVPDAYLSRTNTGICPLIFERSLS